MGVKGHAVIIAATPAPVILGHDFVSFPLGYRCPAPLA
jgi:hypothetical protein